MWSLGLSAERTDCRGQCAHWPRNDEGAEIRDTGTLSIFSLLAQRESGQKEKRQPGSSPAPPVRTWRTRVPHRSPPSEGRVACTFWLPGCAKAGPAWLRRCACAGNHTAARECTTQLPLPSAGPPCGKLPQLMRAARQGPVARRPESADPSDQGRRRPVIRPSHTVCHQPKRFFGVQEPFLVATRNGS